MQPVSFLDDIVARFQHRWQTDSQYRAMMSGIFAVVVLVSLCSCAGIVSTVTNNVFYGTGLASVGGGAQGPGEVPTGGVIQGFAAFPTPSLAPWTPGTIPNPAVAPASGTPPPTPTPIPTPTPTDTPTCYPNCGGGGGGGGGGVTITITGWSPFKWTQGNDSVTVHTSVPNDGVNLIIKACDNTTQLNSGSGVTDGAGNYTFTFNQLGPSNLSKASVNASEQNGASTGTTISCG